MAVFIVLMAFVRKGGLSAGNGVDVYAYFKDASGISKKSRVQIAGIGVGEVRDIVLEGTRAKILLRIKNDVHPHQNASLAKRSESLLGDYVIDLDPGTEQVPLLKDGEEIRRVVDSQGMTQIFTTLDKITGDIQSVTGALRSALGGEKGADSLERSSPT